MYRKHFALTAFPFDLAPEPEDLFASATLGEAEARLKHLLELRGIGLVTGEAGSGKTTVCRKVAASLHPGLYRVFYVPLSTGNVMDMYKSIARELGLPTEHNRAAAFRVIRAEITRLTLEAKQRPVLIVDEAHRLRLAGTELPLFEPPAVEALFQATQGMPRKVNRLAHYALTSAAIDKDRTVNAEHVQAAREEVTP